MDKEFGELIGKKNEDVDYDKMARAKAARDYFTGRGGYRHYTRKFGQGAAAARASWKAWKKAKWKKSTKIAAVIVSLADGGADESLIKEKCKKFRNQFGKFNHALQDYYSHRRPHPKRPRGPVFYGSDAPAFWPNTTGGRFSYKDRGVKEVRVAKWNSSKTVLTAYDMVMDPAYDHDAFKGNDTKEGDPGQWELARQATYDKFKELATGLGSADNYRGYRIVVENCHK